MNVVGEFIYIYIYVLLSCIIRTNERVLYMFNVCIFDICQQLLIPFFVFVFEVVGISVNTEPRRLFVGAKTHVSD